MLDAWTALNGKVRIGWRIAGGFLFMMALLAGLAAVGWTALSEARSLFIRYGEVSANVARISDLRSDVAEMRRQAVTHLETGTKASRSGVADAAKVILDQAKTLKERVSTDALRASVEQVASKTAEYAKAVEQAAVLRERRTAAVEQGMDRLGQQAFTILNGVILTAIAGENFKLAAVLGLANGDLAATRIAGLNYLTSTNVELLEDGKSSMEALRESLDQAEAASDAHGRSEVKKVQDLLPRYEAAFNEAAEAIAATDKIRRDLLAGLAEAVEMELNGLAISQNEVVEAITREVRGVIEANLERLGVITVAAILIGLIIQSAISVGITGPIRLMTGAMGKLAAGDLTAEIPAKANRDELGAMAQSIQIFKDNGLRVVALEAEQKEIAARADAEKRAAMERLANDFELSVNGVVLAVTESAEQLQASATQMSSTAQETKRQVRAVANASEQASTNVQTAASAAEELSSSISEIGRQVEHSTNIAGKAVQDVARTGETVQALADAAQRIGNVVNLISEIASQTNLLALNATIEAARAGEAGKGFAVVAAEVKNLAAQTARATNEISGQVAAIQSATGASVEAMQGIGATIDEMREIAASIAAAVEQQGAATQEIARNVQEAAAGADEVSGGVHGVTQAAEETGAASQEVQNLAQTLGDQSAMLRQEVESFLELVRAA